MAKNPLSNAGDVGSIPGLGTKIPHAAEELSPHTTTKSPRSATKDPACRNKDPTQPKIMNKLINK